jgi:hypothetical protein
MLSVSPFPPIGRHASLVDCGDARKPRKPGAAATTFNRRRWVENRASRRFTRGTLSLGGPVVLDRFEDSLVVCTGIDIFRLNMVDTVENLILDLLEWVGRRERTYQETMEAWRTSCPRLPVWEDATDRIKLWRLSLPPGWFTFSSPLKDAAKFADRAGPAPRGQ